MHTLTLLALSLLTGTVAVTNYSLALESQVTNPVQPQTVAQLPNTDIETIASDITVQVHVDEDRGSGILIAKDNNTYTVITNAHVIDRGDTYTIQTPDGIEHEATLVTNNTEQSDLAVLEFESSDRYSVATIGNSDSITEGETVVAAGFPDGEQKLLVTQGKISLTTQKPLQKGYSIGFTNETVQGMSGGVLLNADGEVIGVLGKGKDAILDTAYDYIDGTTPNRDQIATFRENSFSIPIANIADLSPQLAALVPGKNNPEIAQQPEVEAPTQPEYTGIVKTVDDIAEQITVRIDRLDKDVNGSGVIVAKQGNTYYGITAKHVLCTIPSVIKPECEPNGTHQIVTNDGATHQLDYQNVEAEQAWLDIAIFSFESNNDYPVATVGAYDPGNSVIFVSGFPKQNVGSDSKPARLITGGRLIKEEVEELSVKDTGSIAQSKAQGQDGLVYTNLSYPGMSGGAVLDSEGRLIGINTGSENEIYYDESGNYDEYSLGFSLGEAVTDFIGYLEANQIELKQDWLSITQKRAPSLNEDDINSIETQLLTAKQPQDNTDLAAWMNYGNQLWRYGRDEDAVDAFEQVIAINPEFDRAYYAIGLARWYQENYTQAVTALLKATEINPNPYYYWRYLGFSYRYLEQYDEAISAYEKAIAKSPEDFVLYLERADVLRKNRNYPEAIVSYNQAIEINPRHPWIYGNRGIAYAELEQYQQALTDYNQAIEINPQNALAYSNRGLTYAELEQYQQAFTDYNQAIEINPQYALAYYNRGVIYYNLEQYDSAIADYNQAIEINPQYIDAYVNRGATYAELEQYQQAIADYTKAIEINPQLAEAYNNRGLTYYDLEQYDSAISDYNQAIEINPQLADAYVNRGDTYYKLEQYQQALGDFSQAIEINPQYALAYYNRGLTYYDLEQYDSAISDFSQAIEINPQYIDAYLDRGLIYVIFEQYDSALADYSQAIEINPQFALAYFGLGVVYIELENIEEARTNLEKAQQLFIAQNDTANAERVAILLEQLP